MRQESRVSKRNDRVCMYVQFMQVHVMYGTCRYSVCRCSRYKCSVVTAVRQAGQRPAAAALTAHVCSACGVISPKGQVSHALRQLHATYSWTWYRTSEYMPAAVGATLFRKPTAATLSVALARELSTTIVATSAR